MSDNRDLLTEIRDGVHSMDRRQAAQMETLTGLVRDIHSLLTQTAETLTDHNRRLANLEARMDRLESARRSGT
ncbi:hypothetical protein [Microvirga massiliensis]|uniref:hypothetical protein n=1 Tax=Microvirga massiliensis TaxID=1033741 RepID=UPI00062B55F4|nr:hypothetical protein [Microvirga massiliensis]